MGGVCLRLRLNCSLSLLIIVPGVVLLPHCGTACFWTCFGTRDMLPFAHDLWPFFWLQKLNWAVVLLRRVGVSMVWSECGSELIDVDSNRYCEP